MTSTAETVNHGCNHLRVQSSIKTCEQANPLSRRHAGHRFEIMHGALEQVDTRFQWIPATYESLCLGHGYPESTGLALLDRAAIVSNSQADIWSYGALADSRVVAVWGWDHGEVRHMSEPLAQTRVHEG